MKAWIHWRLLYTVAFQSASVDQRNEARDTIVSGRGRQMKTTPINLSYPLTSTGYGYICCLLGSVSELLQRLSCLEQDNGNGTQIRETEEFFIRPRRLTINRLIPTTSSALIGHGQLQTPI